MAVGAAGYVALGKLFPVNIIVAVFTLRRRGFEIRVDQFCFQVGRLVAVDARGRPMRPHQGEVGFGMIEGGEFLPRLGGVASLAPSRRSIGAHLLHAIFELTFVRILVTTRAIQILPVINDRGLGLKSRRFLVALRAGHGDMTTG